MSAFKADSSTLTRSELLREEPPHHVENGPPNGERQKGQAIAWRA
jgi:hypothetical protein